MGVWGVREGLMCEEKFEQEFEAGEGVSQIDTKERSISGRGNSRCQGPAAGHAWSVHRTARRPMWLVLERKVRDGMGHLGRGQ